MREVVDAIGEPDRALGFEHQPRRSLLAHLLHEVVLCCDDPFIVRAPLRLRLWLQLIGFVLELASSRSGR